MIGRQGWGGAHGRGIAKPFIVLAAKFLGPGPTRLRLVKLAHEMGGGGVLSGAGAGHGEEAYVQAVQPTERAA